MVTYHHLSELLVDQCFLRGEELGNGWDIFWCIARGRETLVGPVAWRKLMSRGYDLGPDWEKTGSTVR